MRACGSDSLFSRSWLRVAPELLRILHERLRKRKMFAARGAEASRWAAVVLRCGEASARPLPSAEIGFTTCSGAGNDDGCCSWRGAVDRSGVCTADQVREQQHLLQFAEKNIVFTRMSAREADGHLHQCLTAAFGRRFPSQLWHSFTGRLARVVTQRHRIQA